MSAAKKPRVVRKSDLERMIDLIEGRGGHPTAYDLLPGGVVRIHLVAPANDAVADDGSAGWDAALGA